MAVSRPDVHGSLPVLQSLWAFVHAIHWTEPLIVGLVTFHLLLLTTVIVTRHSDTLQLTLFFVLVMALPLAQPLNILCAQHWPSLATQPYFDPQGFFAFVFWGGPLLLLAIGVLVRLIIRLFQLMILMKRRQLRASQQRWETQPQQTAGDDSSPAANLVKE